MGDINLSIKTCTKQREYERLAERVRLIETLYKVYDSAAAWTGIASEILAGKYIAVKPIHRNVGTPTHLYLQVEEPQIADLRDELRELQDNIRENPCVNTLLQIRKIIGKIRELLNRWLASSKKLLAILKLELKQVFCTIDIRGNLRKVVRFHFKNMSDCSGSDNNTSFTSIRSNVNLLILPNNATRIYQQFRQGNKW